MIKIVSKKRTFCRCFRFSFDVVLLSKMKIDENFSGIADLLKSLSIVKISGTLSKYYLYLIHLSKQFFIYKITNAKNAGHQIF